MINITTGQKTLIAGTCINLSIGVIYAWSVIKKSIVSQWGWTHSEANIPYTVGIIVWAIALLLAGMLQDRFGPKRLIQLGVAMVGTGLMASSFVTSPLGMMFTFGIGVATGIGFTYACITPCCMKWFHHTKKGMVSGITVGGFGLAAVYLAPLTGKLISVFGISETFLILGIGVLLVAFPMTMMMDNPPATFMANPPKNSVMSHTKTPPQKSNDLNWQKIVKTKEFYLLWIMFAFSSSAGVMMIGHLASIASVQAGMQDVALIVSLLAVSNATGRVGGGILSDKIGRRNTMLFVFSTQLINMLAFIHFTNLPLIALGTVIAGLSYGSLMSVFPSITADKWGMKNYGTNYGVLYLAWGISGVVGPLIAAWAVDTTGTYELAYMISAVLLGTAMGLGMLIKPAITSFKVETLRST
ncbi:OFA family MFS transporter [Limnohabitans sp.]|jgi:OFA family oxalate/formate antiporter-like MFS transporter|uniref:L-lactate MFS transporter n=1 Tax=Limnohabitans sp. TaxID=1907725 RepID=UPI0037BE4E09